MPRNVFTPHTPVRQLRGGISREPRSRKAGALFIASFFVLVQFLLAEPARAQDAIVSGFVLDATNEAPLSGATLSLYRPGGSVAAHHAVVDGTGAFYISGVEPGTYVLSARHLGFAETRLEIRVQPLERQRIDLALAPVPISIDAIVVSASRLSEDAARAPAAVSIIDGDQLVRDASPTVLTSLAHTVGVDVQQAGLNRYNVAVRGFNKSFNSKTYALVDHRETFNPSMQFIAYTRLPIDATDIDHIEVVRGPATAIYGPGVDQGIIHFLTKDPFSYPGTAISVGLGEHGLRQMAFRHAGVIRGRLGYKITGSAMEGEDWKLDPDDPHDEAILSAIIPTLTTPDGTHFRDLDGRDYGVYSWRLGSHLQYRFSGATRIVARADYAEFKNIANASLGELQFDGAGLMTGQVRLASGSFEAQAFGILASGGQHAWFYREGRLMVEESVQLTFQARNQFSLFHDRLPLSVGVDYIRTTPRSKRTVFGRFEGEDAFSLVGGYASTTIQLGSAFELSGSGRLDYLGTTDAISFSPRIAVVAQPRTNHTFRLAFNRALARPDACKYYCDLRVGKSPAFNTRYRGSTDGFTFGDSPWTSSFLGPGRDEGIGISLNRVYAALISNVAGTLVPENSGALETLLVSRISQIEGFSDGRMTFRSRGNELLGVVETLRDLPPLKEPVTQSVEMGYRGLLSDRLILEVAAYYTKRSKFQFDQMITPFVEVSTDELRQDLRDAVLSSFSDTDLAPYGISAADLATAYSELSANFADRPMGIIEPVENFDSNTMPEQILTSVNAGTVDYYGVEVSAEAVINDRFSAYANYSWLSDNHFDEAELGLVGTGYSVSMNAPMDKLRLGLAYEPTSGIALSGAVRYTGSFRVDDGNYYHGVIDAYTLFDLGMAVDFSGAASGLTLAVNASNILNNVHREYIGFPRIGRLVSSRLTYSF